MSGGEVLVVTGTGTGVGKTVVTAALVSLATSERRVAVVKPVQTGVAADEDGDLDEVRRLAGPVTTVELARYPDPLAPATAARRCGRSPVRPVRIAEAVREATDEHDLVLVEGAGGLLVHCDDDGGTLADVAALLDAPVLVVAAAGLGTLNSTALTVEALSARGLGCPGVVIGSWPHEPDLACRCNLVDMPTVTGRPLLGALTENAGTFRLDEFRALARDGLAPELGGQWEPGGEW
ncbi:ATP-dependent dethiobiotin synthetase BioD [Allosaccharopolyspora coralli]|uniref:ATP-dependent dethiobiotin synthetase BioD n=1 Tax=Allosaccharopolyspora coralli TaxID=2665642 RepID=A0A5Q3Q6P7_9PSEU|nr:dethiobiotin synthase [Allosaccharopolyspora coralli]QGK68844.1 ATP-dependent dethiobiotin synthetase BioD [Allosaccharopolyspora coralli]